MPGFHPNHSLKSSMKTWTQNAKAVRFWGEGLNETVGRRTMSITAQDMEYHKTASLPWNHRN